MRFRVGSEDHDVADKTCPACTMPYPVQCECGGLVHGNVNWDRGQDLMLSVDNEAVDTKCDRCKKTDQLIRPVWKPSLEDRRNAERIAKKLTGKDWDFGGSEEEKSS
jgi:tRNA G26 N,N-dimethylase Trm1